MTVTYSIDVATANSFSFIRLLKKWNGSVYKIIWFELISFLFCYALLSVIYRNFLSETHQNYFEIFCVYSKSYSEKIPIVFVLGFYVNTVASRWWDQFLALPWPDTISIHLLAHLAGTSQLAVLYRRNIIRYVNASYCLALRAISSRARLRFPTEEHLVTAGILTSEELEQLQNSGHPDIRGQYFVCLNWAQDLVIRARKEMLLKCDVGTDTIIDAINDFRSSIGRIFAYDWINPPLVYTQTATISVYCYFLLNLFAWQFLDPTKKIDGFTIDIYVPVFGLLNFIFIMGWLKVAESLINPFGEDDDDFEIEYMIERNLEMSYSIVHGILQELPPTLKGNLNDQPGDTTAFWSFDLKPPRRNKSSMIFPVSVNTLSQIDEEEGHTELSTMDVNSHLNHESLFLGSLANLKFSNDQNDASILNTEIANSGRINGSSFFHSGISLFKFNRSNSRWFHKEKYIYKPKPYKRPIQ